MMADMDRLPDLTRQLHTQNNVRAYLAYARNKALRRRPDADLPDTPGGRAVKAAIGSTDDAALRNVSSSYLALVQRETILGRMQGAYLSAPPLAPIVDVNENLIAGGFVAEGKGIPLAKMPIGTIVTEKAKLAALMAFDKRTLEQAPRIFESALTNVLRRLEDRELLSSTAAVANVRPAGLLNGVAAVGNAATSLPEKLAAVFAACSSGSPRAPFLVVSAGTALALAAVNGGSAYPAAAVNGRGNLAGIPLLVSAAAGTKIIEIDAGHLVVVDELLEVAESEQAAIEMSDTPTGDAIAPAGGTLISMYQTNAAVIRATRFVWWKPTTPDAVAFCETV